MLHTIRKLAALLARTLNLIIPPGTFTGNKVGA
jgi:hypothetical protein